MHDCHSDRLYGNCQLPPKIAQLITCPTFQRLGRINQSGASKYCNPFKTVTRLEHSLGVYLLLQRLGASEAEQVAGLLHDISHTAFSHVIDIVFYSEEQDFHEGLKAEFLSRPDLRKALTNLGFQPGDFTSDESYTLLEQPLPALCADRIDYSLRDAVSVGEITVSAAREILDQLSVHNELIVLPTPAAAYQFARLFKRMNDTYWADPRENFLYELLAQAIEIGLDLGVLSYQDLLTDDDTVEAKLCSSADPRIEAIFAMLHEPPKAELAVFKAKRPIKQRAIDPAVLWNGSAVPLSLIPGNETPPHPPLQP